MVLSDPLEVQGVDCAASTEDQATPLPLHIHAYRTVQWIAQERELNRTRLSSRRMQVPATRDNQRARDRCRSLHHAPPNGIVDVGHFD